MSIFRRETEKLDKAFASGLKRSPPFDASWTEIMMAEFMKPKKSKQSERPSSKFLE